LLSIDKTEYQIPKSERMQTVLSLFGHVATASNILFIPILYLK